MLRTEGESRERLEGDGGASYTRTAEPTDGHLSDYLRVLHRHRWSALTLFTVIVVSVLVFCLTKTPVYEAKAEVLIENGDPNVVAFKEVLDQEKAANDYYQTQYRILQSRSLARRTIAALKLWNCEELSGTTGERDSDASVFGSAWRNISHLWWTKPSGAELERPGTTETAAQSVAIDRFLARLTISPLRNSRLVDIYFRSFNPDLAARVANGFAQAYIEQNLDFKFMASKEASDWLNGRLAEQRSVVEAGDVALQRYREQNNGVSLEERQNIVVQKLGDLNAAVTRAKTERIQKEALYNQIRAVEGDSRALDTIPAILGNGYIQSIKADLAGLEQQRAQQSEKLGDRHPEMVRLASAIQAVKDKLQSENEKVISSVHNDYLAAVAQERSLVTALEEQKREAMDLNRKSIEYDALDRDAKSNHQIFDSLLQRTKETGISGELKTSNIHVVDQAETPRRPVSPDTRTDVLLAILAGGVAAVMGAFFFEYFDSRIKTPADLERHLGLACLGLVPMLPPDFSCRLITNGVPDNFTEAFHACRTNLMFSSAGGGSRSVVITSTGPQEGKTLASCNLAISLAQAGLRVLLVDADMRRPTVHDLFDVAQEPGLSNVLVGNALAREAVRRSPVDGLWILPAGLHPPNAATLVAAQGFKELLSALAPHFDWVIIDSPPIVPVTDASILGHWAAGVILVVSADMTSHRTAAVAVARLEAAKANCLGAILNRVDLEHQSYYYSSYYRSDYAQYYTSSSPS